MKIKIYKTIFFLVLLTSCNTKPQFSITTFAVNKGFGYKIERNDKVIIKQSIIPTLPNQHSFKTKTEALKVGNLVIQKIKNHQSPTVSKKELILLEITLQ